MKTMKEIAKATGLSISAVSYALSGSNEVSEETRKRVVELAARYGYQPNRAAKSLKTKKTNNIGIISEDLSVFNMPDIINGIGEFSEASGYSSVLVNLRAYKTLGHSFFISPDFKLRTLRTLNNAMHQDVDGFIYIGAHYRDVTGLIENVTKPIVYTYCFTHDQTGISVNYDDGIAANDVTTYLIQRGHRRIAAITGMPESIPSKERLNGFFKSHASHGLSIDPDYIRIGSWESESGFRRCKELMSLERPPTAIFAFNDAMAEGVMEAAASMDLRIPEDLSVIGFDNMEYCNYLRPKLSSVQLPLTEMGVTAAKTLVEILKGNSVHETKIRLPCSIIVRNSIS